MDITSWVGGISILDIDSVCNMDYVCDVHIHNILQTGTRSRVVMVMTKKVIDSESAGAALWAAPLVLFIVGCIGMILAYALQKSQGFFTGLSADASNTIWTLEVAFVGSFIIFFIAVILNAWITEKSDANQGV
jgi:hypothetical protein